MARPITSAQNQRIKNAVKLRDRRGRAAQGRIVIDGAREIRRALEADVELSELFVCEAQRLGADAEWVRERAANTRCEVLTVVPRVFEKLAFGGRTEGIVAVARTPTRCLEELVLPAEPLVAVLEGVEKPGNLGAVVRSADGAGLAAVFAAAGGTDLYNPNAIRASLGTVFTVPLVAADSETVLRWLGDQGFRVFAARVGAGACYRDVSLKGRVAVVLGSEAGGLSPHWQGDEITAISLPMRGAADSLNVAATAAVLFYEALRQREAEG